MGWIGTGMLVVIDNYDSFTFNLVQYLGELGVDVVTFRNDAVTAFELERMAPRYMVISPGPGRPEDAGVSVELIRRLSGKIPILGVCLGHQAIAQAFGGRIIGAGVLVHGKTSEIFHDGGVLFRDIPNPFVATRYHSLIVDRASLPSCLEVSAETADGLIMGLRHKDMPVEGVQFHPESVLTSEGKKILANFLEVTYGAGLWDEGGPYSGQGRGMKGAER